MHVSGLVDGRFKRLVHGKSPSASMRGNLTMGQVRCQPSRLREQVCSRLLRMAKPLQLQCCLDFGDYGIERGRIKDGDFREALAVELDVGGFEAGDKLAVAEVALAAGGTEPRDPQPAKIALAGAAV